MKQIITKPIINSILDNDLYKFSMMNFALNLFPESIVTYKFKNRGEQRFNRKFIIELQKQINYLANLKLTNEEYIYLKANFSYLTPGYIEYLKNFRYNPLNISIKLTKDNDLELNINGKWVDTILFEVPLMAIISELYFKIIDTNWDYDEQKDKSYKKIKKLSEHNCNFVDMGSRRRRSKKTQDMVIETFVDYSKKNINSTFLGSSNVNFAKKYNLKCFGTMGHEIIMHSSVEEGLRNANYYALMNWKRVFTGSLGTFLPDNYGVDSFLNNFTLEMSKLYDGLRWDSGDWRIFTDKVITHYQKIGIDPLSKMIVYSDSLNDTLCVKINNYCKNKIKASFGIGTFFTNNGFKNSLALNMVIKLNSVRHNKIDVPVVKLSDSLDKIIGNQDAIRVAKWTFFNCPLDL